MEKKPEEEKGKAGTTRIALWVVGLVVAALAFIGGLMSWRFGDRALASEAIDTLKIIVLLVLAYYFGKETAK